MGNKKFLKVTGKQIRKDGTLAAEATAVVPYENCGRATLPHVPPFDTNVWLGGDTGYHMTSINYTLNGLEYFYNRHYDFIDGKIHAECEIKGDLMAFDFELIDLAQNADER